MSFPKRDWGLAGDCSDEERLRGGADGEGRGGDDLEVVSERSEEDRLLGVVEGVGRGDGGGFLADFAHQRRRMGGIALDKAGKGRMGGGGR